MDMVMTGFGIVLAIIVIWKIGRYINLADNYIENGLKIAERDQKLNFRVSSQKRLDKLEKEFRNGLLSFEDSLELGDREFGQKAN